MSAAIFLRGEKRFLASVLCSDSKHAVRTPATALSFAEPWPVLKLHQNHVNKRDVCIDRGCSTSSFPWRRVAAYPWAMETPTPPKCCLVFFFSKANECFHLTLTAVAAVAGRVRAGAGTASRTFQSTWTVGAGRREAGASAEQGQRVRSRVRNKAWCSPHRFRGGTTVGGVWAWEKPRAFQRGIDKLQREPVIKYCINSEASAGSRRESPPWRAASTGQRSPSLFIRSWTGLGATSEFSRGNSPLQPSETLLENVLSSCHKLRVPFAL